MNAANNVRVCIIESSIVRRGYENGNEFASGCFNDLGHFSRDATVNGMDSGACNPYGESTSRGCGLSRPFRTGQLYSVSNGFGDSPNSPCEWYGGIGV